MKISCIVNENVNEIIQPYIRIKPTDNISPIKKIYHIDTNLDTKEIDKNFKNIVKKEQESIFKNINYFRVYLKHFYDYEITEIEIERILKKIQNICKYTKIQIQNTSFKDKEKIMNLIDSNIFFYKKKNKRYCCNAL
jgi:hypothetical protein